jgi:hypothetical protein
MCCVVVSFLFFVRREQVKHGPVLYFWDFKGVTRCTTKNHTFLPHSMSMCATPKTNVFCPYMYVDLVIPVHYFFSIVSPQ